VIGRYRLCRKSAKAAWRGLACRAKRTCPRRVALKLIKAGMNSREVVARFESERRPCPDGPSRIAKCSMPEQRTRRAVLRDGVRAGVPITTYCDNHSRTRDRLELFMHVCEGVQHGTQKAIIIAT